MPSRSGLCEQRPQQRALELVERDPLRPVGLVDAGRAALQQRELREPARLHGVEPARARLVRDVLPGEPRLDPAATGARGDGAHCEAVDGVRAAGGLVARTLPLPAPTRHAPPQLELQGERAPRRGIRRLRLGSARRAVPAAGVNVASSLRQSPEPSRPGAPAREEGASGMHPCSHGGCDTLRRDGAHAAAAPPPRPHNRTTAPALSGGTPCTRSGEPAAR